MELAQREYYWNIHNHWIMYALMIVSLAVFGWGVYKKIALWRKLKPAEERTSDMFKRAWLMISEVLLQRRVRRKLLPGIFHSMIFWSFIMLMLATMILTVELDIARPFGVTFFYGNFYLLISFMADIAGIFLIAGLLTAIIRRYVLKPASLQSDWQNAYMLILLLFIGLGGFALEGMRIKFAGDAWAAFSPVGLAVSWPMGLIPESMATILYQSIWWLHAGATFLLIASLPYTKFAHILLIPANYMFSSLNPKGALERVDMEELLSSEDLEDDFSLGHTTARDLTWKNAMDLDACIECGRCEDVCPARQCGYALNPREVVKALKNSLYKMYDANEMATVKSRRDADNKETPPVELSPFIGDGLDKDTIWMCRTCRACMEVCPAMIEHVDQIIDIRRSEVMMNGQLPTDAKGALKALETRGNPFGPQQGRVDWIENDPPKVLKAGDETDVLFWIGCVASFDQGKRHIAENMIAIMRHAGIRFAVLGDEEFCCGDPARCLGDENVYQSAVKQQIEILNSRKFNKILVICPHCLNSLKNEFKQFGGNYEVVHHSQFITELIKQGRIKLTETINSTVVYHDPCYLGRYEGITEEPRQIIKSIKGVQFSETRDHGTQSFCCGGGGGNYFMDMDLDSPGDERLNLHRVKELSSTAADTIAVSCPYCMQMLEDGVKTIEMEETLKVADISTLVVRAAGIKVKEDLPLPMESVAEDTAQEVVTEK